MVFDRSGHYAAVNVNPDPPPQASTRRSRDILVNRFSEIGDKMAKAWRRARKDNNKIPAFCSFICFQLHNDEQC